MNGRPAAAAALLLATIAASGSDPAARAALGPALGEITSGCTPAERQRVIGDADIAPLGRIGSRRVVLVSLHGECVCGNVNCPYLVLRLDPGGAAKTLLSTYAFGITPVGTATPLPNLRELAHDSALVSIETTDAYRDGSYVSVDSARVRGDTGARKSTLPLRFAPGTSSTAVHGAVSLGWYDEYALAAQRGQHITVSDVHSAVRLTFTLFPPRDGRPAELQPGVPAELPADGTYQLHVDGGGDADQAYRATITIR